MSFTDTVKRPIVATDAFVCVSTKNGLYILVIERKFEPYGYAFPGGKLDFGEMLYDGAKRELWEETGLEIDGSWDVNGALPALCLSNPNRDPRTHVISFVFRFSKYIHSVDDLPVVKAMDDAKSVKWMHIDEVRANKVKFVCDHYDLVGMLSPEYYRSDDEYNNSPSIGMFEFR
jgi:8-oxo-dGTP diphosphatase